MCIHNIAYQGVQDAGPAVMGPLPESLMPLLGPITAAEAASTAASDSQIVTPWRACAPTVAVCSRQRHESAAMAERVADETVAEQAQRGANAAFDGSTGRLLRTPQAAECAVPSSPHTAARGSGNGARGASVDAAATPVAADTNSQQQGTGGKVAVRVQTHNEGSAPADRRQGEQQRRDSDHRWRDEKHQRTSAHSARDSLAQALKDAARASPRNASSNANGSAAPATPRTRQSEPPTPTQRSPNDMRKRGGGILDENAPPRLVQQRAIGAQGRTRSSLEKARRVLSGTAGPTQGDDMGLAGADSSKTDDVAAGSNVSTGVTQSGDRGAGPVKRVVNWLLAGLRGAAAIVTVSPTYAREVRFLGEEMLTRLWIAASASQNARAERSHRHRIQETRIAATWVCSQICRRLCCGIRCACPDAHAVHAVLNRV